MLTTVRKTQSPSSRALARAAVAAAPQTRLAFLGTYPPRRCGIATFTRDLAEAVTASGDNVLPMALAVSDSAGSYDYPPEVKFEIRQGAREDYLRAAEFVNRSDAGLVSIQHEYGIFGGDDGSYVLDFLAALRVPAIATLHTTLKEPSHSQRAIVRKMAERCAKLVVMSQVAADLLVHSYGVGGKSVSIIPHGIPDLGPRDARELKLSFGIPGKRMLLTFGLLGPNKGIETVIHALPALVKEFPDAVYFVVGATHPAILRQQGEAYRQGLEREAERLGVREHVVFRDQYVSNEELFRYLQAADIFVTPYLAEAQVTSGALSYAMGAGAAAVSTPYWHARELLAEGRGCLFPFGDSVALGKVLASLLSSPGELARVRSAAHAFTRQMVWPLVGRAHFELGRSVVAEEIASPRPVKRASADLPELQLDHLQRMTDDTGIIQHATFSVPARRTGYCVDDNARALIVALQAEHRSSSPETRRLITTYLSFLHYAQKEDGGFSNLMTYDRRFDPASESDDCLGRALWALGTVVRRSLDPGHRLLAQSMFERALPSAGQLGPRGTASTLLGLVNFLSAQPDAGDVHATMRRLAERLVEAFRREAREGWRWFEPSLTYDNALLPLALFKAYGVTGDPASLAVARESLQFLEDECFRDQRLVLVGNDGWHRYGGTKASADEQALDATAFVLAFRAAYRATGDSRYLDRMRESFAWFLGANRLGLPLYDAATGGCRDGLGATVVNQNQGAESTISFLLSLLEMIEFSGEGVELASGFPLAAGEA